MSSSVTDPGLDVRATSVQVTDETIVVELEDGRTITVPTAWYPRLRHATPAERGDYEIGPFGVEWPEIEADFSIRGLLLGRKSSESPTVFKAWLDSRRKGRKLTFETYMKSSRRKAAGK